MKNLISTNKLEAIIWFIEEHRKGLQGEDSRILKAYFRKWQKPRSLQEVSIFLKTNQIPRLSQKAQVTLSKWIDDEWPIILWQKIPSPKEMLEIQAQGKRFVSWLPNISGPILGKENNWEFMLHDLMHAERFFHSEELYEAQTGFFRWLKNQDLEISGHDWDYLRSDMNTHPVHALQFLKHLLDCKSINLNLEIPHWSIINSPEFFPRAELYSEEIKLFFRNYLRSA